MSLDWNTSFKMPAQRRPILSTTTSYPQSMTVPQSAVPQQQQQQQRFAPGSFPPGDLSDISPSSESIAAEDLFQDSFLFPNEQYIDDWTSFDPLRPLDSTEMNFTDAKLLPQQTLDPSELAALADLPIDIDALTAAASGEPLIVGSVEQRQSILSASVAPKRLKAPTDSRAACWTSPLCPNHNKEGTPPNPSTCNGGCAPYLFDYVQSAEDDASGQPALSIESPPSDPLDDDDTVPPLPTIKSRRNTSSNTSTTPGSSGTQSKLSSASPRMQLKRESTTEDLDDDDYPVQVTAAAAKGRPRGRVPHNQVERKYRESLNTQLESLRKAVPELSRPPQICDGADIEDLPTPSKPSKAVILASATSYIKQMEKEKRSLVEENRQLKIRLKALQSLVKCDDCGLMQYVMDLKINGAKQ